MQYQQLGNTGVFVSRLCLGAMTFGGETTPWNAIGGLSQHDASALVDESIEAGVNFFDTANVYSGGESETLLGKALGSKRHNVVIATKVFARMGSGANEVACRGCTSCVKPTLACNGSTPTTSTCTRSTGSTR